jgi:hypothetical protein
MVDSGKVLKRAEETLQRLSSEMSAERRQVSHRIWSRRAAAVWRKIKRIILANILILVGMLGLIFTMPIGLEGVMLGIMLMILATILLAIFPKTKYTDPTSLQSIALRALPAETEIWLEGQRKGMPTGALRLMDDISTRLAALEPQLTKLESNGPAAYEIRKLVGEQLPELINGYHRIPADLRKKEMNGRVPDQQLTSGLQDIREELAEMTLHIASGDLDSLATRSRYIELRYRSGKDEG